MHCTSKNTLIIFRISIYIVLSTIIIFIMLNHPILNTYMNYIVLSVLYAAPEIIFPFWFYQANDKGKTILIYSVITRLIALVLLLGVSISVVENLNSYLILVSSSWILIATVYAIRVMDFDARIFDFISIWKLIKRSGNFYGFNLVSAIRGRSFDVFSSLFITFDVLAYVGFIYRIQSSIGDLLSVYVNAKSPSYYSSTNTTDQIRIIKLITVISILSVLISIIFYIFMTRKFESFHNFNFLIFVLLIIQFIPNVLSTTIGNLVLLQKSLRLEYFVSSLIAAFIYVFAIIFLYFYDIEPKYELFLLSLFLSGWISVIYRFFVWRKYA